MSKTGKYYVIMHEAELKHFTDVSEKDVYMAIKSFTGNGKYQVALSLREIAGRTTVGFMTVSRCLPKLIEKKFITKVGEETRFGGVVPILKVSLLDTPSVSPRYTSKKKGVSPSCQGVSPSCQGVSPPASTPLQNNKTIKQYTYNEKSLKNKNAKTSLTPCSNLELFNVALLVKTKLDNVLKKHTDLLLMVQSGEMQSKYPHNKSLYFTLINWLRRDLARGYIEPMSEFEELTIKSFHPVTGNQKEKYVRYWAYCKERGVI